MNATERAKRSDELHYDNIPRRALCDRIANLESDLEDTKTENDKLWKLCRRFSEYVSHDRCEGCVVKRRCNDGEIDECWQMGEIRKLARNLGIEVDA